MSHQATSAKSQRFERLFNAASKRQINFTAVAIFTCALAACQGSSNADVNTTISSFTNIEHQWSRSKVSWIEANVNLISKTCVRLTPTVRRKIVNSRIADSLAAFDDRKVSCEAASQWRASLSQLQQRASQAADGDEYESVQAALTELREKTDLAVQEFPTSAFKEAGFPSSASMAYRAKHEATASEGGTLAAQAVALSRDASGAAMKTASSSDHELDKSRARLADEAFTKSSSELAELASYTAASEVVAHVDELMSTVDGAIGSAQRTGEVGGSRVTVARESLPSAAPTLPPTPRPSIDVLPAALDRPSQSDNASDASFRALVQATRQISIVASPQDCRNVGGLQIRFKDDGAGGCAMLQQASHSVLNSGNAIDLIPVTSSVKGTIFALLYADTTAGSTFVGILPGNGEGNLDVRVDDGVIVERNGNSVKRSTYQNGRVVAI